MSTNRRAFFFVFRFFTFFCFFFGGDSALAAFLLLLRFCFCCFSAFAFLLLLLLLLFCFCCFSASAAFLLWQLFSFHFVFAFPSVCFLTFGSGVLLGGALRPPQPPPRHEICTYLPHPRLPRNQYFKVNSPGHKLLTNHICLLGLSLTPTLCQCILPATTAPKLV